MNRFYTEIIPSAIVVKLKEAGYPQDQLEAPYYADVFDWLMEKEMCVSMFSINTDNKVTHTSSLMDISNDCKCDMTFGYKDNWYESANVAIEKALEVLSEKASTNE